MTSLLLLAATLAQSDLLEPPAGPDRDAVTLLQKRIDKGEVRLAWDREFGYLPALLKALQVPIASQGLVFSKTSLQIHRIHPQTPRAIYFNDEVYVGYVPGGDVLEVSAVDPVKGGAFFTLDQEEKPKLRLQKRDDCLQCHASPKTLGVPGHLVRSVWTQASGYPLFTVGGYMNDHNSPMKERFGGWYVTGTTANAVHMGNQVLREGDVPESLRLADGANVNDLNTRFSTNRYLAPHSDVVALLVLSHQAHMHNLIARANLESRIALEQNAAIGKALGLKPGEWTESTQRRIHSVCEALVRYMLFRDEPALPGAVRGTSDFAAQFQAAGRRDAKGRSLRELDLEHRLFRYPVSWLIESEAFDSLPAEVRAYVYRRIRETLSASGTPRDRTALEILSQMKPEFVRYNPKS